MRIIQEKASRDIVKKRRNVKLRKNSKEKGLTKIHTGVFARIKRIFQNLIVGKEKIPREEAHINTNNNEDDFRENIQIKQEEEEKRILKLQQDFKKGIIEEKDLPEEDYKKILKLYNEQNEKIKQEIEMYRKETAKILEKLKK